MTATISQRFGFIPSPQTINTDDATAPVRLRQCLRHDASRCRHVGIRRLSWGAQAENVDGLPVGFARMTGVPDPATGQVGDDRIGLTCAACHTGQIHYKGIDIRFDGGPAMTDLRKLEVTTGLSIAYTLLVPGPLPRFADRVLGPAASETDRDALKQKLQRDRHVPDRLGEDLQQKTIEGKTRFNEKTKREEQQQDTEEGYRSSRRAQSHRQSGLLPGSDAERPQAASRRTCMPRTRRSAIPPIWTVPWLKFAQYDASIEQPLIRNAGEALRRDGAAQPVRRLPQGQRCAARRWISRT